MIRPYVLAWLAMVALAFVNGAVREFLFVRWLTTDRAHQISTVTLLAAFAVLIAFVIRRWPPASAAHALAIGVTWAVAVVAFEFGLGWFGGQSWREMLAAYDVRRGSLWPLIPLFVAVAPFLFRRRL